MPIEKETIIEVERDGSVIAKPLAELRVGETFSYKEERWFVDTHLMPFKNLQARAVFRKRGEWFLRAEVQDFAFALVPNLPFGTPTNTTVFRFQPEEEIGALSIEQVK